jgi:hypothetical protein
MANPKAVQKPDPIAEHHRQAAWQIWAPLGLGIALVVGLCVICAFIVLSPAANTPLSETLAPVATIWLVIPNCITSLIPIAILFGCVFLSTKMLGGLPRLGARIRHSLDQVEKSVQSLSDRLAKPIIQIGSLKASWNKFWEVVSQTKPQDKGG